MATVTAANQAQSQAQTAQAARPGIRRLDLLRSFMLTVIASSVAFGVLTGLVGWQANATTYSSYHTIVDEGSVSVDAALRARAAALDHMSASATYLETTGDAQKQAATVANERWAAYNNESRISWRNLSDATHGENNVYTAADSASSDYIQQIGSMYAFSAANQRDPAGAAFLQARETLNTRLVPALGGLEAVKVEDMEATYAGASERITRWRYALIGVAGALALILLAALLAVRLMHYRVSWPVVAGLAITAGLAVLVQADLGRASSDARVMVRDAYDSVAGVQDLEALLSQGQALNSIAIFDPKGAAGHLAAFDQYNTLVEQKLCGPRDCTKISFLANGGGDTIDPQAQKVAEDEQSKLGLPRTPLIANVHFRMQAAQYEKLRLAYRTWRDQHDLLAQAVQAGKISDASAISTGAGATAFAEVVRNADAATQIARTEYNNIWQRVYSSSTLDGILSAFFPASGLLAAYGVWRRRQELFG